MTKPLAIALTVTIWLLVVSTCYGLNTDNPYSIPCMEDETLIATDYRNPDGVEINGVTRICVNTEDLRNQLNNN